MKKLTIKADNTMDYSSLIEYGRKITEEKMLKLQYTLNLLDNFQEEIDRVDSYHNSEEKTFHIKEKYYYVLPFFEDEINDNYYKCLNKLFKVALDEDLLLKYDYGIIINIKDNEIKKFVGVEVDKKYSGEENIIKIHEGYFLCKKTSEFDLTTICHMFDNIKSLDKTIVLTPVYSYDFSTPYFELKCSL